ncbi:MAG: DUF6538 domain-containing protein, partial [Pseudomonadota bacterium]|nr:DUF6538 domain-containing protein [Pseudomonadota bacterium]
MSQTVIQNHAYLIRRNGIFYFSRRVPADVRTRFNKDRVIVSLHTRSLPRRSDLLLLCLTGWSDTGTAFVWRSFTQESLDFHW